MQIQEKHNTTDTEYKRRSRRNILFELIRLSI